MLETIIWFIPRIVTIYFMISTFLCGVILYFLLMPSLKESFPTESTIAKYGGLIYMIGGPLLFFIVKLIF